MWFLSANQSESIHDSQSIGFLFHSVHTLMCEMTSCNSYDLKLATDEPKWRHSFKKEQNFNRSKSSSQKYYIEKWVLDFIVLD